MALLTGSRTVFQSFDEDITVLLLINRCATGVRGYLSAAQIGLAPLDSTDPRRGVLLRGDSSRDWRISSMASGVALGNGTKRIRRGEVATFGILVKWRQEED